MTYKELMDKCSEIWKRYAQEGNSYLGLTKGKEYCVRHYLECEDITPEQKANIESMDEYKEYIREIEREKRKKEIDDNIKNNPEEYQKYLEDKKRFEL